MRAGLTLLFVTTVIVTGVSCGRSNSPTVPNPAEAKKSESAPSPASNSKAAGRDEISIGLTSDGFVPAEITHSAGVFGIVVQNEGQESEYTLRLKTQAGKVLEEIKIQKGSTGWSVNLLPGRYTLTEAKHPQWVCRITVQ